MRPLNPEPAPSCSTMDAPAFDEWQVHAARQTSRLEANRPLLPGPSDLHILKSSQLDAERLDVELGSMLHSQFMKIFSHFQQNEVARYEPELQAVIMLLVYALTVARGLATPGSQLLNLRYRNEWAMSARTARVPECRTGVEGPSTTHAQRAFFGFGYVLLPYLWGRLGRLATQMEWNQRTGAQQQGGWMSALLGSRTWSVLRGLETTYKVSAFANLLAFLQSGVYRSLLERAAGMRLVYQQACMTRVISFEYLNRQLVWQELSELLLFMLPLLDVGKFKRVLLALLARLPNPALLLSRRQEEDELPTGAAAGAGAASGSGKVAGLATAVQGAAWPSQPCPVCGSQQMLLPFEALPCRHVFCYYCLRSNCEADAGYACPVDGVRVDAMRRWGNWAGAAGMRQASNHRTGSAR